MRRLLLFSFFYSALVSAQIPVREVNTSMAFPAEASLNDSYLSEDALGLWFDNPVAIVSVPGETNRLFVVDQEDGIYVVPDMGNPTQELFLDLTSIVNAGGENGVLGLAFHPAYASNGFFYVFLTGDATTSATGNHDRLLRYGVTATNVNRASLASEMVLFEQYSPYGNHNGGDLHFGLDGYLYVSLGDGGGYEGQSIDDDFFNGILRIDVDALPGSLMPTTLHAGATTNYGVPSDNPFVGATNFNGVAINTNMFRGEFWATGFRNPWRFTIDSANGQVIVGDVGEGAWEEVNVVLAKGNYGWPFREGPDAFTPWAQTIPPVFDPIEPVAVLGHPDNVSVIGGVVYHGSRLPELEGFYVYSDWKDGVMWGFLPNGTNAVTPLRLAQLAGFNTVCYGTDPRNGDILFNSGGQIRRLVANPGGAQLPLTLADTGAFTNLTTLAPATGIVPYEVNIPLWADHAVKQNWFSVPELSDTVEYLPTNNFSFPEGAVWIKQFDLEMERGNTATTRRVETRFLVKTSDSVYGLSYRWTGATQAVLVGESGYNEDFLIQDGTQMVVQTWAFPSRAACLSCHTPEGGYVLGFNAPQLSRAKMYGAIQTNQLLALSEMGYFTDPVTQVNDVLALAPADDTTASLTWRARSYFQANCGGCHRVGTFSSWDAAIHAPLDNANIIGGVLDDLHGDPANRIIVPGDSAHSMILTRMGSLGGLRMPPIGTSVIDTQSVQLVRAWINELVSYQDYGAWALAEFGSANAPGTGPNENMDADPANNLYEFLTRTDPNDEDDFWTLDLTESNGTVLIHFDRHPDAAYLIEWSPDLLTWQPWDVAGNSLQFSTATGAISISGSSASKSRMYFRMKLWGH